VRLVYVCSINPGFLFSRRGYREMGGVGEVEHSQFNNDATVISGKESETDPHAHGSTVAREKRSKK
jgi:hypothetical protein